MVTLALFNCPYSAYADSAVPVSLTVQGDLQDIDGDPINGVTEFEIKIYRNGTAIWRTLYKVGVNNGSFSIQLGDAGQSAVAMKPGTTTYKEWEW